MLFGRELGAMIEDRWSVSPSKGYCIKLLADLLDIAILLKEQGPPALARVNLFMGPSREEVLRQLDQILRLSDRDLDGASTIHLVSKLAKCNLGVGYRMKLRLVLSMQPWTLRAFSFVYRFMKAGSPGVKAYQQDLAIQRQQYLEDEAKSKQSGRRFSGFY